MKKIFLLAGCLCAGLAFTACNEDLDDWQKPQANEQEQAAGTVTATADIIPQGIIKYEEAADEIQLLTTAAIQNMDNAVLKFTELKIGDQNVDFSSQNGTLVVSKSSFNDAVDNYFKSKKAVERTVPLSVKASAVAEDGQATPVDVVINESTNEFQVEYLQPTLPGIAYESAYYYVGGANGWNLAQPTPMTPNGDGTYSCTISCGGEEWFAFAPQSAVDAQDWNSLFRAPANGDTSTSGFFNLDSTSGFSFKCELSGAVVFTISPEDWTYSYEKAPANFYFVTGSPNGWTTDPKSAFYSSDGGVSFEYTTNWTGAWDLKAWALDDVGNWDNAIGTEVDGDGSESGTLINQGAQAFQSPAAGFYTLHADFKAKTYYWIPQTYDAEPVKYDNISLAGDFNSWGDTQMEKNADGYNWYILGIDLTGKVKFKANNSWDVNWGATMDVPGYGQGTQGGPDIPVPDGKYNIYLNTITGQCVFIAVQ